MRRSLAVLGIITLAAGCSPDTLPIPPVAARVDAAPSQKALTVFSQNLYIGADVDVVLASSPENLQANLFTALQTFAATNYPERADAIAAYIARQLPDVIALNEVSTIDIAGLGPFFPDTHVDFLAILQQAIAAHGADYVLAGEVANIDATLALGGPTIRLQDFDAVLVRRGVAFGNTHTGNYAAHVPVVLAAGTVDLRRGYVTVDITEDGRTVRFVASHFEPQETSLPLQLAQSAELISVLDDSPYPVVIASDLNTNPAATGPTTYTQLLAAGFQDAWLSRNDMRPSAGLTCCQNPDLQNPMSALFKRIDLVMVRPEGKAHRSTIRPVGFTLFGDQSSERTASGLWPSDHAGLFATMEWKKLGN